LHIYLRSPAYTIGALLVPVGGVFEGKHGARLDRRVFALSREERVELLVASDLLAGFAWPFWGAEEERVD
jgi:hypothetical protein